MKLNGEMVCLWRASDHEGELLEIAERRGLPCMAVSETGPNRSVMRSWHRVRTPASSGITSRPASRSRTASWNHSMSLTRRVPVPLAGYVETDHEAWRTDYNTMRSHSSISGMAPAKLPTAPTGGMATPKLTYQRPEYGEQVIRRTLHESIHRPAGKTQGPSDPDLPDRPRWPSVHVHRFGALPVGDQRWL